MRDGSHIANLRSSRYVVIPCVRLHAEDCLCIMLRAILFEFKDSARIRKPTASANLKPLPFTSTVRRPRRFFLILFLCCSIIYK